MIPENLTLLNLTAITRINERIPLRDPVLRHVLSQIPGNFNLKNFQEDSDYDALTGSANIHSRAFLQIAAETVFNYPNVYVTEKSFKPIIYKRPFVLVGSPGCLNNLKSFGFKTFNQYWDESYDLIEDPEKRMLAILEIIEFVCAKSIDELQKLCYDMKNILEHNFNLYCLDLEQHALDNFDNQCRHNLKPRYSK